MGLFGVFATIFSGVICATEDIKDSNIDSLSKKRAIENNCNTWTDSHGYTRLVSNNEKVVSCGGKLISVKDGRVIVDYSKERINKINAKNIEKAKRENKKGVQLIYPEFKEKRYYTELSTMKRYYLDAYPSKYGGTVYKKVYYTDEKIGISTLFTDYKDEEVEITKEEFKALGGYYCGGFQSIGVQYDF